MTPILLKIWNRQNIDLNRNRLTINLFILFCIKDISVHQLNKLNEMYFMTMRSTLIKRALLPVNYHHYANLMNAAS